MYSLDVFGVVNSPGEEFGVTVNENSCGCSNTLSRVEEVLEVVTVVAFELASYFSRSH